jgi:hypothetical protein
LRRPDPLDGSSWSDGKAKPNRLIAKNVGYAGLTHSAIDDRFEISNAIACFPKINHEKVKIGSVD